MKDSILIISGLIAVISLHVFGFYAIGDSMGLLNDAKDSKYWKEVKRGIYISLSIFIPSIIVFLLCR